MEAMKGKVKIVAFPPNPSASPAPLKCVGIVSGKFVYINTQIAKPKQLIQLFCRLL
jgi:hypothetical protein